LFYTLEVDKKFSITKGSVCNLACAPGFEAINGKIRYEKPKKIFIK
jgi:hypothetical protein